MNLFNKNLLRPKVLGTLIFGGALLITFLLISTRPEVHKTQPQEKATLVSTVAVKKESTQITFTAYGTVQGIRELTLTPEVTGTIIERSPNLIEGGIVQKGEVLLKIDPRDYQTAVEQEKASLARALLELQLEQGRQVVAEKEWDLLGSDVQASEMGKELALHRPHIAEKKAAMAAAESRLKKAELDLKRTHVTTPFDAIVLEKWVELGQRITPQNPIAKLIATDAFQVRVSLPYDRLNWIDLPSTDTPSQTGVIVRRLIGEGKFIQRQGKILRLLGDVDIEGRMIQLLVSIPDPLSQEHSTLQKEPFLIGTYVEVLIEGPKLENIFLLPRTALREGNTLWIKTQTNRLEIRPIHIVWKSKEQIAIDQGLEEGDEVITSSIVLALPDMPLRIEDETP